MHGNHCTAVVWVVGRASILPAAGDARPQKYLNLAMPSPRTASSDSASLIVPLFCTTFSVE